MNLKVGFSHVSTARIYSYMGIIFESHPCIGFVFLKKDLSSSRNQGYSSRRMRILNEWSKLSREGKEKYRIK